MQQHSCENQKQQKQKVDQNLIIFSIIMSYNIRGKRITASPSEHVWTRDMKKKQMNP